MNPYRIFTRLVASTLFLVGWFSYLPTFQAKSPVFFTFRPAIFPELLTILKAFSTEIKSVQSGFVLSADCDSLSLFPNKLIPLTVGSLQILMADNISAEIMNRYGDKGHPCLTP